MTFIFSSLVFAMRKVFDEVSSTDSTLSRVRDVEQLYTHNVVIIQCCSSFASAALRGLFTGRRNTEQFRDAMSVLYSTALAVKRLR
jgi:hypothetical protein